MPDYPPAVAVTRPPLHHFFGYYEKCPWDRSGRYILAMESTFIDRMPSADDPLTVGMIDTAEEGRFVSLDRTTAWCWQQGTMLRWLPPAEDRQIIYNTRQGERFASIIRDVHTGQVQMLPRPVYAVSPDGRYALSLNFARLARTRPGYGYEGIDPWAGDPRPADDGVYCMDLATGQSRLIFSLEQAAALAPRASQEKAEHWFNHIQINPDGSRFGVIHRWRPPGHGQWLTRFLTMNPDGSDVFVLADNDYFSHYDWLNTTQVMAHTRPAGLGDCYCLLSDRTREVRVVGEGVLTTDGHMSFTPDRRWVLTDTYPDQQSMRTLLLYRMADGRRVDIGRFYSPPQVTGPWRCDLHPRWNRQGMRVCIDSAHEPTRQMYVIDVEAITRD